jgi:hypothetical protein
VRRWETSHREIGFSAFYGWIFVKKFSKRRLAKNGEQASFSTPPLTPPLQGMGGEKGELAFRISWKWEGRRKNRPAAHPWIARGNLNSPPL